MLLKDLNREETGVANETRDILPHLVFQCPSKPPGPRPGGTQATQPPKSTRQEVPCSDPQLAYPSMLPPLTVHPTIVRPCHLGSLAAELNQPPHIHPCECKSLLSKPVATTAYP